MMQPTGVLECTRLARARMWDTGMSLESSMNRSARAKSFAASKDKDAPGMLRVLLPHFQRVIATEFQENPRAIPVEQIAQWCRDEKTRLGQAVDEDAVQTCPLPADAWRLALQWTKPDQLLCITGSFFIAAELRGLATAAAEAAASA